MQLRRSTRSSPRKCLPFPRLWPCTPSSASFGGWDAAQQWPPPSTQAAASSSAQIDFTLSPRRLEIGRGATVTHSWPRLLISW
jgi:hypothetical protein